MSMQSNQWKKAGSLRQKTTSALGWLDVQTLSLHDPIHGDVTLDGQFVVEKDVTVHRDLTVMGSTLLQQNVVAENDVLVKGDFRSEKRMFITSMETTLDIVVHRDILLTGTLSFTSGAFFQSVNGHLGLCESNPQALLHITSSSTGSPLLITESASSQALTILSQNNQGNAVHVSTTPEQASIVFHPSTASIDYVPSQHLSRWSGQDALHFLAQDSIVLEQGGTVVAGSVAGSVASSSSFVTVRAASSSLLQAIHIVPTSTTTAFADVNVAVETIGGVSWQTGGSTESGSVSTHFALRRPPPPVTMDFPPPPSFLPLPSFLSARNTTDPTLRWRHPSAVGIHADATTLSTDVALDIHGPVSIQDARISIVTQSPLGAAWSTFAHTSDRSPNPLTHIIACGQSHAAIPTDNGQYLTTWLGGSDCNLAEWTTIDATMMGPEDVFSTGSTRFIHNALLSPDGSILVLFESQRIYLSDTAVPSFSSFRNITPSSEEATYIQRYLDGIFNPNQSQLLILYDSLSTVYPMIATLDLLTGILHPWGPIITDLSVYSLLSVNDEYCIAFCNNNASTLFLISLLETNFLSYVTVQVPVTGHFVDLKIVYQDNTNVSFLGATAHDIIMFDLEVQIGETSYVRSLLSIPSSSSAWSQVLVLPNRSFVAMEPYSLWTSTSLGLQWTSLDLTLFQDILPLLENQSFQGSLVHIDEDSFALCARASVPSLSYIVYCYVPTFVNPLHSVLSIQGNTLLHGSVTVDNTVTAQSLIAYQSLSVGGNATVQQGLDVHGSVTVNGAIRAYDSLSVTGSVMIQGETTLDVVTVNSSSVFRGPVQMEGPLSVSQATVTQATVTHLQVDGSSLFANNNIALQSGNLSFLTTDGVLDTQQHNLFVGGQSHSIYVGSGNTVSAFTTVATTAAGATLYLGSVNDIIIMKGTIQVDASTAFATIDVVQSALIRGTVPTTLSIPFGGAVIGGAVFIGSTSTTITDPCSLQVTGNLRVMGTLIGNALETRGAAHITGAVAMDSTLQVTGSVTTSKVIASNLLVSQTINVSGSLFANAVTASNMLVNQTMNVSGSLFVNSVTATNILVSLATIVNLQVTQSMLVSGSIFASNQQVTGSMFANGVTASNLLVNQSTTVSGSLFSNGVTASNLRVNQSINVSGSLFVNGVTTSNMLVNQSINVSGSLFANGVTASNLLVNQSTTLLGNLTVLGSTLVIQPSSVAIQGTLSTTGNILASSSVSVAGSMVLQGPLTTFSSINTSQSLQVDGSCLLAGNVGIQSGNLSFSNNGVINATAGDLFLRSSGNNLFIGSGNSVSTFSTLQQNFFGCTLYISSANDMLILNGTIQLNGPTTFHADLNGNDAFFSSMAVAGSLRANSVTTSNVTVNQSMTVSGSVFASAVTASTLQVNQSMTVTGSILTAGVNFSDVSGTKTTSINKAFFDTLTPSFVGCYLIKNSTNNGDGVDVAGNPRADGTYFYGTHIPIYCSIHSFGYVMNDAVDFVVVFPHFRVKIYQSSSYYDNNIDSNAEIITCTDNVPLFQVLTTRRNNASALKLYKTTDGGITYNEIIVKGLSVNLV